MKPVHEVLLEAKALARRVLSGDLSPGEGCAWIAELCELNDWPEPLVPFSALAHEQDGHDALGFNRENTVPLVLTECRRLLGEAEDEA